jgi:hypothetical protein
MFSTSHWLKLGRTVPLAAYAVLSCVIGVRSGAAQGAGNVLQDSAVPSIEGQKTQLYVRETVLPGTLARGIDLSAKVVLFVHGAGTPAEVAYAASKP